VIVPSHSYIASANAVLHAGARPVFADIHAATLNLDPVAVAATITPRTRAIMVVHQVGRPADLVAFAALARQHRLVLLEDAACAIGSEYHGKPIGDTIHAPLVCFSFHPRKVLTTGDGGMITTGDAALARTLRLLRQHGMSVNDLQRHHSKTVVTEEYPIFGYNYRLTDVQAAIGLAQLRRLDGILQRPPANRSRLRSSFPRCARRRNFSRTGRCPLEPADLSHSPDGRHRGTTRRVHAAAARPGNRFAPWHHVHSPRSLLSRALWPATLPGKRTRQRPMRLFAALLSNDRC